MDKQKAEELLEKLKSSYAEYEISILPIKQQVARWLVVVNDSHQTGDLDDWSIDVIRPIGRAMADILGKYEGGLIDFRLLFIRCNQFVLWSPDVGTGNAFAEFKKPLKTSVYGYESHQHYVGECQDIQDVLNYLTGTSVWY